MLDLYPDEEEVDLPDNDVLQMIPAIMRADRRGNVRWDSLGLVILELNMQAVFNPNFHLD
jgi:hypothetical protein